MTEIKRGDRIQKIIARSGLASRRKAEEWIREGRVTLNGTVCKLGDRVDADKDWIKVDGRTVVEPAEKHYVLLNKPSGFLATVSDPEGRRTVLELVPKTMRRAMFPVGRLDYQTEGLLLLTSDGDWANRVAHPRYGCVKTYEVKVRGIPTQAVLDRLARGIVLEGRRTAPCQIEPARVQGRRSGSKNTWWSLELEEGRNRQIRKMFQQVGHPVMRIRRVGIGPLTSRGLPIGACRELDPAEVEALRRSEGPIRRVKPKPTKRTRTTVSDSSPRASRPKKAKSTERSEKARPTKKRATSRDASSEGRSGKKSSNTASGGRRRSSSESSPPHRKGPNRKGPSRKGPSRKGPGRKGPSRSGPNRKDGGRR